MPGEAPDGRTAGLAQAQRGCGLCGLCSRAGIGVTLQRVPTHALGHDSRRESSPHGTAGGRVAPLPVYHALKGGWGRVQETAIRETEPCARGGTAASEDPWTRLGSAAAEQGLSCPKACGIFFYQGLNPRHLHWKEGSESSLDNQDLVTDLRMNSATPPCISSGVYILHNHI